MMVLGVIMVLVASVKIIVKLENIEKETIKHMEDIEFKYRSVK